MATCDQDHVGEMTDAEVKAIEDLPESQKSAGRHKCAFCAYLLGVRHAGLMSLEQILRAQKLHREKDHR